MIFTPGPPSSDGRNEAFVRFAVLMDEFYHFKSVTRRALSAIEPLDERRIYIKRIENMGDNIVHHYHFLQ